MLAMLLGASAGLGTYLISSKLIFKYQWAELKDGELQSAVGGLSRVLGMLVSLMLSLAFSSVIQELKAINHAMQREAVAISDIFNSLERIDVEGAKETQDILVEYTEAVIVDDWSSLANDQLGKQASALKRQLTDQVLGLEASTPLQQKQWSQILSDLDMISDHRLIRLDAALAEPPGYIYAIGCGFLLTMACFGVNKPTVTFVVLAGLLTAFVGVVIYLVLALSDPFQSQLGVDPKTFETMLESLKSRRGA